MSAAPDSIARSRVGRGRKAFYRTRYPRLRRGRGAHAIEERGSESRSMHFLVMHASAFFVTCHVTSSLFRDTRALFRDMPRRHFSSNTRRAFRDPCHVANFFVTRERFFPLTGRLRGRLFVTESAEHVFVTALAMLTHTQTPHYCWSELRTTGPQNYPPAVFPRRGHACDGLRDYTFTPSWGVPRSGAGGVSSSRRSSASARGVALAVGDPRPEHRRGRGHFKPGAQRPHSCPTAMPILHHSAPFRTDNAPAGSGHREGVYPLP